MSYNVDVEHSVFVGLILVILGACVLVVVVVE